MEYGSEDEEHRRGADRSPERQQQALDRNATLWKKAMRLEFLLLNLVEINKRQKKVCRKKIKTLAKLLNHAGYQAAYIAQCRTFKLPLDLHKRPPSAIDALELGTPSHEAPSSEDASQQPASRNPEDTESDMELQHTGSTKTPEKPSKALSMEQIRLEVPQLLPESSLPGFNNVSHPQIIQQFATTKSHTLSSKPH